MNPYAWALGDENTTGTRFDRHDMYLTCHIGSLKKRWVIRKNQLLMGHIGIFLGKCGIRRPFIDMQG